MTYFVSGVTKDLYM